LISCELCAVQVSWRLLSSRILIHQEAVGPEAAMLLGAAAVCWDGRVEPTPTPRVVDFNTLNRVWELSSICTSKLTSLAITTHHDKRWFNFQSHLMLMSQVPTTVQLCSSCSPCCHRCLTCG